MKNFPYIEPIIRIIAGFLITVSGCLIYARPDMELAALALLFFVSLNLLQSGFTHFCIMEKILKRLGFRSELGEIKNLNKVNADHLDTLNLLSEVVVELSSEGRIVRLTDSWGTLFGIDKADISKSVGKNFTGFMNIEDRLVMEQLLKRVKESSVEVVRFRMQRDDNSEHWTEGKFTLYSNDRFEPAIRGVLRDVTDSYLQEKRISHMAMHDALTNLPNRVLLEDRMERAVSQARRSKEKVAVLFVDLDNFKQVNDVHGHKIGDQLLVAISAILKKTLRGSDTLARWGGDEFVILLQGFNQVDDAQKIAEKLMGVLQKLLSLILTGS
jgi:diguanylate cyclase (GGDEF)-like protein/PAS domain S-box-containing protein